MTRRAPDEVVLVEVPKSNVIVMGRAVGRRAYPCTLGAEAEGITSVDRRNEGVRALR